MKYSEGKDGKCAHWLYLTGKEPYTYTNKCSYCDIYSTCDIRVRTKHYNYRPEKKTAIEAVLCRSISITLELLEKG